MLSWRRSSKKWAEICMASASSVGVHGLASGIITSDRVDPTLTCRVVDRVHQLPIWCARRDVPVYV